MLIENLKARLAIIVVIIVVCVIWMLPNFVDVGDNWIVTKAINYGLDIQGGLHLVMGVDIDGVVKESALRLADSLKKELEDESIGVDRVEALEAVQGELQIALKNKDDKSKVVDFVEEKYSTVLQILDSDDDRVNVRYYDSYLRYYSDRVLEQAIETIRNRIDEFGVSEPSISAQGSDRILVQLPGIENAERAKQLINTTAKLEFMIVSEEKPAEEILALVEEVEKAGGYSLGQLSYTQYIERLNADLSGKLPEKTLVYFEKNANAKSLEMGKTPYLLKTDTDLSGEDLKDAFVSFDQFGRPEVSFRLNSVGSRKMGEVTGNNVGKQLAIVLDRIVKSAPSIKSRITEAGVISLGRGDRNALLDEAKMISMSLRAGALPASLQQLEERTVGPTLGADSIARGKKAGLLGGILVLIFMLLFYKSMGFIADLALGLNIFLLLAVLTSLEATLTLPGVAGIVLTVGMAVDANVIIFERIKEELRKGTSWRMAVKEGYGKAFSAIFDANITTAAVCVVLMYFGTGPVRGFAVTLIIGIFTSMFTAIFCTRAFVELMMTYFGKKKLSI